MASTYVPQAVFDHIDALKTDSFPNHLPSSFYRDFEYIKAFLISYQHNAQTFKSFRREVERFMGMVCPSTIDTSHET